MYICTVSYTLLLNGSQDVSFNPSKSSSQGDPLSPYLFIIGSEELARLINREAYSNAIKGVKVAANAPAVTKLFFVEDVNAFL